MQFRETKHIFGEMGEVWDPSWMLYDKIIYPETQEWDYKRELKIEDVEIWEVIKEWSNSDNSIGSGGFSGIYAAWRPHAELYMVKLPVDKGGIVTFYGYDAEQKCKQFLRMKGIEFFTYPASHDPGIVIDKKGLHYKYKF